MKISPELSNKIANMGIVCAILVTAIHVFQSKSGVIGSPLWFAKSYLGWSGFAGIGVPFFFLVSGFFLAGHFAENGWYRRSVKKRVSTLFVPYVLWCMIWLVTFWMISIAANIMAGRNSLTNVNCEFGAISVALGLHPFHNPAVPSFWYVRMLMVFVLIAPLFRLCLRKPILWFALMGLIYGVAFPLMSGCLPTQWAYFFKFGLSLEGVVYFSFGMALREWGLPRFVNKKGLLPLSVALTIFTMAMVMRCCQLQGWLILRVIGLPFAMLAVWRMIPERRWPDWFVSASFAVFATHQLVIALTQLILHQVGLDLTTQAGDSALWWIVMTFVYASVGIAFAFIIRWAFPLLSSKLFGGR